MKTSRLAGYVLAPVSDMQEDGNDEVAALPVGMTAWGRGEVEIGSLANEEVSEAAISSDEAIRAELDRLYAGNPALLAEHLRKQAQAKARKVVETAKRLGLSETAAVKFIARGLRS